ncbi:MAG: gas vesicle protein, partial [Vicinamibacterales bacterium]
MASWRNPARRLTCWPKSPDCSAPERTPPERPAHDDDSSRAFAMPSRSRMSAAHCSSPGRGVSLRDEPRFETTLTMSNQIEFGRGRSTGLVEVLDRILDKGLFIGGDIKISLAEV